MSDWRAIIGISAGIFSLLGFFPYIITILQGKTKPNRASWSIWASLGIILAISNYSAGARETLWLLAAYAVCQLIIAILSLKCGEGGWNTFDRTCLFGAGISIILWWIYNSPLIAILISIAIDSLGALPTIKKSYYQPETEDLFSWLMFWAAGTLNMFALGQWSVELVAQPLYLFSFNSIVVFLLLLPKLQQSKVQSKSKLKTNSKQKTKKPGNSNA
jgi:hypothetical protein